MKPSAPPISHRKLSTRLIRKGALIEETYAVLGQWDLGASLKDNFSRVRETNPIGASNAGWLREVVVTLSSRFSTEAAIESLVVLAQGHVGMDVWRACLLWHIGATDELYYRFATEWLFEEYQAGAYRIRTEDVVPVVRDLTDGRIASGGQLTATGTTLAARDLLRMATDFGLLTGRVTREFRTYHLPEEGFLYVLHALAQQEPNARRLIQALEWRLYLMDADDVEREILHLHQYRKLHYEVAGSLAQLDLPCKSPAEYARRMVA